MQGPEFLHYLMAFIDWLLNALSSYSKTCQSSLRCAGVRVFKHHGGPWFLDVMTVVVHKCGDILSDGHHPSAPGCAKQLHLHFLDRVP